MDEIMERVGALLDELNNKGIEFSTGQHAIVCKDGVVILDVSEDGAGISVVNNRLDLDYELGISNDAVAEFKAIADMEEAMEYGGE